MWSSLGAKLGIVTIGLALAVLPAGAFVACGGDDDGTSPESLMSRLLPASEFPGFKSELKFDWDNPIDFAVQGLHLPQATPPSDAVEAFENAGFEAGVGESFVAAKGKPFEGPRATEDVVQFGSDDDAREALAYVHKEALKQPCFATCSVQPREFAVPGIPSAKGVQLTPLPDPPSDAPHPFVSYGVSFTIGPRLFLVVADGGPGQVEKDQVVDAAEALYKGNT